MYRQGLSIASAALLALAAGCTNVKMSSAEKGLRDGDLLIVNAVIVDGTGAPGYPGGVLVRDGRIESLGNITGELTDGVTIIDADGRIVAPGFIDTHSHGDPDRTPEFHNFLAQGVTTICLGQDGSSPRVSEMEKWFADAEAAGVGPNVALFAGHGTLRRESGIGLSESPTPEQIAALSSLVEQALALGCYGMTTGLEYQPGTFSSAEELAAIAQPIGATNTIIKSHMRNEDDDQLEASIQELIAQGEAANARVHISHIKSVYGKGSDRGTQIAARLREARRNGVGITADIYPYEASFTGLSILFPDYALPPNEYEQVRDTQREELADYLYRRVARRNGPEATLFGSGTYAGKTLAEVSEMLEKPYQDVLIEMGPGGGSAAYFVMNEELQSTLLLEPYINICSDGAPGMRHPRGYGSFPKVIRKYVVEDGALTIEEAVHKMTGLPATTIGFDKEGRGFLRRGFAADLVLFHPEEVRDTATFEEPFQLAEGIDTVIVNGVVVRHGGTFTGESAGRVLRRGMN